MFGLDPDIFCNIDYRVKHGNDMETKKRDRTLQDGLNKIVFLLRYPVQQVVCS